MTDRSDQRRADPAILKLARALARQAAREDHARGEKESTARRTGASRSRELPRLAYRVDEAATVIGLGKSKVWELIQEGRLAARKIDGATIVLHADLEAFLVGTPPAEATKRAQSSKS